MSEELADGEYQTPAEIHMKIAGGDYALATADLPVIVKDGKVIDLEKNIAIFLREMAQKVESRE